METNLVIDGTKKKKLNAQVQMDDYACRPGHPVPMIDDASLHFGVADHFVPTYRTPILDLFFICCGLPCYAKN